MPTCITHLARVVCLAGFLVAVQPAATPAGERNPAEPEDGRRPLAAISGGLRVGACLSQHAGTKERDSEYAVASQSRTGIAVGGFLYMPVTSRFGIQQELLYVQKGSLQDVRVTILDIPTVLHVTYDMDYIEIPSLLKFAWFQGRTTTLYSMAGTALSLKVRDRYTLFGELDDGSQVIPLHADADMSEVDIFDFSFVYGLGAEWPLLKRRVCLEYRFVVGWNSLSMPTYASLPFGDETIVVKNDPVPLKNQAHLISLGVSF